MARRRRSLSAGRADRHAVELAARLGRALHDARKTAGLTQRQAAAIAALSQSAWSALEVERDVRFTLGTWDRAAHAVGASLDAFLRQASAAGQPRDIVHLRNQELVIRTGLAGGWQALPEELIDREARTSRAVDVLLTRAFPARVPRGAAGTTAAATSREYALIEVYDWFADAGQALRDWGRRLDGLERYAISRMRAEEPLPRTGGAWVVRATQRNRRLIGAHANFFHARFAGSGRAWLDALAQPATPMPKLAALIWASVEGERLFGARLG